MISRVRPVRDPGRSIRETPPWHRGVRDWWRPSDSPVASPCMPRPGEPMTDLLRDNFSLPSRLGVVAEVLNEEFRLRVAPAGEVLHNGAVRASVIAFMIDVVAGSSSTTIPMPGC